MKIGKLATALWLSASALALPVCALAAPAAHAAGGSGQPANAMLVNPKVDPNALGALNKMSAYLRALDAFTVKSDTARDEVNGNGQKLQFLGSVTYEAKRPNSLVVETAEDRRDRKYFYDGKTLTVYAPRMGYYATVAAPGTTKEMLDFASKNYGIVLPLEDLFLWGSGDDRWSYLIAGYWVGPAMINGQASDQYAFRQNGVDWQIWIARGDKPLPLRVVVTSSVGQEPQFSSNLTWDTAPAFTDDTFKFTPPDNAKPIKLTPGSE